MGRILGAFSLLALAQHSFQLGIGQTFLLLLQYYDDLLQLLLGWSAPYIQFVLNRLNMLLGWDLSLYPHWRHIFVLMGLYLFREAGASDVGGVAGTKAFKMILAFCVTLISSIAVGTQPLSSGNAVTDFSIATIPVLGIFIYDVVDNSWSVTFLREYWAKRYGVPVPSWWADFRQNFVWVFQRTAVAVLIIVIGLQIPAIRRLPNPGIALLAFLILAMAVYWLWRGMRNIDLVRQEDEPWPDALWRTGYAHIGAAMLGVFFWMSVFVLLNAGLRLYGL